MVVYLLACFIEMLWDLFVNFSIRTFVFLTRWSIISIEK